MLSRRLLRVKVMQIVYAFYKKGDSSVQSAEKDLLFSISKSFELYHLILLLILELKNLANIKIENGLNKKRPTEQELNPNRRFVDNSLLLQLESNKALNEYIEGNGITWNQHPEFVRNLFNELIASDLYIEYMSLEESNYEDDKKFVVKMCEKVVATYEPLYSLLEEMSVFWNDECEFILSMVMKSIKSFTEEKGDGQLLLSEFKDEEDVHFVKTLYRKAIVNQKEYRDLIVRYSKNWDFDRVAFMDIVLMQIALAELTEFVNIPVKVSLNEYIEIAKHYSTERSSVFINGILDKAIEDLKSEKKIQKAGRGLMDN